MQQRPLRVSHGALRFRCEYKQNKCFIRLWIANTGFDETGNAEFDNDYITLKITANKKGRRSTIELTEFADKPGQKRRSIHRYGDYELIIKKPCFDWFTGTYWKTCRDEEIYIPPKTNLCVHPNPHHKIDPVGRIPRPFQGGGVNPR